MDSTARSRPWTAAAVAVAAMCAAFAFAVMRTRDPALAPGVLHPTDTRQARVGGLSYAEAGALIERRRGERDAESDPARRAVLSAQIADMLARRQQHDQALAEIDDALRAFPTRPELLARRAIIQHARGFEDEARRAIEAAEAGDAQSPFVRQARRLIDETKVTPARRD